MKKSIKIFIIYIIAIIISYTDSYANNIQSEYSNYLENFNSANTISDSLQLEIKNLEDSLLSLNKKFELDSAIVSYKKSTIDNFILNGLDYNGAKNFICKGVESDISDLNDTILNNNEKYDNYKSQKDSLIDELKNYYTKNIEILNKNFWDISDDDISYIYNTKDMFDCILLPDVVRRYKKRTEYVKSSKDIIAKVDKILNSPCNIDDIELLKLYFAIIASDEAKDEEKEYWQGKIDRLESYSYAITGKFGTIKVICKAIETQRGISKSNNEFKSKINGIINGQNNNIENYIVKYPYLDELWKGYINNINNSEKVSAYIDKINNLKVDTSETSVGSEIKNLLNDKLSDKTSSLQNFKIEKDTLLNKVSSLNSKIAKLDSILFENLDETKFKEIQPDIDTLLTKRYNIKNKIKEYNNLPSNISILNNNIDSIKSEMQNVVQKVISEYEYIFTKLLSEFTINEIDSINNVCSKYQGCSIINEFLNNLENHRTAKNLYNECNTLLNSKYDKDGISKVIENINNDTICTVKYQDEFSGLKLNLGRYSEAIKQINSFISDLNKNREKFSEYHKDDFLTHKDRGDYSNLGIIDELVRNIPYLNNAWSNFIKKIEENPSQRQEFEQEIDELAKNL